MTNQRADENLNFFMSANMHGNLRIFLVQHEFMENPFSKIKIDCKALKNIRKSEMKKFTWSKQAGYNYSTI